MSPRKTFSSPIQFLRILKAKELRLLDSLNETQITVFASRSSSGFFVKTILEWGKSVSKNGTAQLLREYNNQKFKLGGLV
jgi:hypothetical protein